MFLDAESQLANIIVSIFVYSNLVVLCNLVPRHEETPVIFNLYIHVNVYV